MPKNKIFIVFSQRFCCEYTALKLANDLNKLPPGKAIWSLYQASLRPAPWPLLCGWRLLTAASWLSCRIADRLHDALMDRLTLKSMTASKIEVIGNIPSETWENKRKMVMRMAPLGSCYFTAGGAGLSKQQVLSPTRWKQLQQSSLCYFFSQPGKCIFEQTLCQHSPATSPGRCSEVKPGFGCLSPQESQSWGKYCSVFRGSSRRDQCFCATAHSWDHSYLLKLRW